jgi:hypothetical protein
MAVSRRTVLRGASIGLVGAGAAFTASCAAAPLAGRFLVTVGTKLVEGFGMAIGNALVDQVPAALASIADLLPDDKGERVGEAMYGYASKVVDSTNLRAAIATNFTKSGSLSDDELTSYAVHDNADGNICVPSVVTLGVGYLASALCAERLRGGTQKAAVQQHLREELSLNVCELIDGSELLNEYGKFRAVTPYARNVEIEWDPTDSATEQCRLTIRYGVVMKGRPDDWERTIDLNIPTYSVWDDAVAT